MNCSDNSSNCQLWLAAVLASLLLMCAGLGLFFFHQASLLKGQVMQGEKLVADYEANSAQRVNVFVTGLQNYSRNNPDLLSILMKYGLQPGAAQPTQLAPGAKK